MLDEFKNAFNRYNNAHVQLIIINVVIFLFLVSIDLVTWMTGTEGFFQLVYRQFSIPSGYTEFFSPGRGH